MFNKKIIVGIQLILIFVSNLVAQDITSGVKLIRNEKYSEAIILFSSFLNTPSKAEA